MRINNTDINILIDQFGVCAFYNNFTGKDLFVGIKTLGEITSFYNGYPIGVTQVVCDYEPDAISPTETGPGDYYSESSVITFSGINRPIDLLIRGYREDGSGPPGILKYKVNGGAYINATYAFVDEPIPAECEYIMGFQYACDVYEATITINSGDTVRLRYDNSSGCETLPILLYNLTTDEELDTIELTACEI